MRAVGLNQFGGPEVLEVVDLPDPVPGDGEIRVRVAAATVNPTDVGLRSGARAELLAGVDPPYVPGMELAGTVDQAGPGSGWQAGDEVLAITTPLPTGRGAQSELVVVSGRSAVRIPRGSTLEQAATLPMNGLTVRRALDLLQLRPGDTLCVTGAAGAVGGYAVQLAAAEGVTVVAVAGPSDEQLVTGFGAAHFVPRGEGVAAAVREHVPGGVDGVVDAALLGQSILPALREGGRLAAVRPFRGEPDRDVVVELVRVTDYRYEQEKLAALADAVEQGRLTLRVAETLPPERAAEAHARLEAGGIRGRLVISF